MNIASDYRTSAMILEQLSQDQSESVRAAALENRNRRAEELFYSR